MLPRWRDSSVALPMVDALPVSDGSKGGAGVDQPDWAQEAHSRVEEWRADQSLGIAADALSLSVFPGTEAILRPVAEAVVNAGDDVPAPMVALARVVLGVQRTPEPSVGAVEAIRALRARLRNNCANPIALVDVARLQTSLGHNDAARYALRIALALAPRDRFVVRSAARFFVHADDPEAAADALRRSGRAKVDPWVLASEIAVHSVLGRSSPNIRFARQLLERKAFPPEHICELASAVATEEVASGKAKEGRRLFNLALVRPNDNTVAQVQWISNLHGRRFDAEPQWLDAPHSMEARCLRALDAGDLSLVAAQAGDWFVDEPFSSRPMIIASFANCLLGRYQEAEAAARNGLRANANDIVLLNNRLFALASAAELTEAEQLLREIVRLEHGSPTPQTIANTGLLLIRGGQIEDGRECYRIAADLFEKKGDLPRKSLALAFLARELFRLGVKDWSEVKAEAEQILAKARVPETKLVLDSIESALKPPAQLKDWRAGRLKFDLATNTVIIPRGRLR